MRPFDLFLCPLSSVAPLQATWMKSNTSTYARICLNMVRLKGRCASCEMRLGPLLPVSQLEIRAHRPCAWHITLCLQLQFSFEWNSLPYYTSVLTVKIVPALRHAIYYGVNKAAWSLCRGALSFTLSRCKRFTGTFHSELQGWSVLILNGIKH